jgi:hypothetical protein
VSATQKFPQSRFSPAPQFAGIKLIVEDGKLLLPALSIKLKNICTLRMSIKRSFGKAFNRGGQIKKFRRRMRIEFSALLAWFNGVKTSTMLMIIKQGKWKTFSKRGNFSTFHHKTLFTIIGGSVVGRKIFCSSSRSLFACP